MMTAEKPKRYHLEMTEADMRWLISKQTDEVRRAECERLMTKLRPGETLMLTVKLPGAPS